VSFVFQKLFLFTLPKAFCQEKIAEYFEGIEGASFFLSRGLLRTLDIMKSIGDKAHAFDPRSPHPNSDKRCINYKGYSRIKEKEQ